MSRGPSTADRLAEAILWLSGRVVGKGLRAEWLEEWRAELAALAAERSRGARGLPGMVTFALGSVPHALWTRTEGWTMDGSIQDIRYAWRILRRAPGFTLVAALTLALGIGANASIFSLVNGIVLRSPAGVDAPERLVQVARSYESAPRWDNFSWPAMRLIRSEARALSGVEGYQNQAFVIGRGTETERVLGLLVTGGYFDLLGVTPRLGRLLQPADDVTPGGHPVVVLSHALWSERLASDPDVIGRSLQVGNRPYEVVGVAPAGFTGVETIGTPPAMFVPATMHPGYYGELPFEQWGSSWINVVGRLADGTSFEEARASMPVVNARLREASAQNDDMEVLLAQGVGLDPEGREEAQTLSRLLLLIVGLVLLLTCSNVANLFLARATGRRTEVGVRMALGAGRSRLVRQLVTESTLLAVLATVLAVPLVAVAGDFLPLLFPYAVSVSLAPDVRVYLFLTLVGLATGLLFGAAPAWSAARRDVAGTLRESSSTGARSRTRLRDALVVSQLALSLGLVASAALLGRSVLNAHQADPGFEPLGLSAAFVDLFSTGRYDQPRGMALYRSLLAEAEAHPDVRAASLANQIPIAGGHARRSVRPAGRDEVSFEAEYIVVGPRYFETMGIPIVRGRPLAGFDEDAEPVVVVNEALAGLFWPGEDPIGQELLGEPNLRVVGVAGDVQMRSLRARASPAVYYPLAQVWSPFGALQVSTVSGRPLPEDEVRRLVASVDAQLPVSTVVDVQAAIVASMGETRTIGFLVGAFALLALVLAAVGLYGLVSFAVSQRVREIGIRVALGAHPDSLVRLILARGIAVAVVGVAVGLGVAYGLGLALQGLLFGVTGTDPVALIGASAILLAAAALAAWLPARRASRVDAAISLRDA